VTRRRRRSHRKGIPVAKYRLTSMIYYGVAALVAAATLMLTTFSAVLVVALTVAVAAAADWFLSRDADPDARMRSFVIYTIVVDIHHTRRRIRSGRALRLFRAACRVRAARSAPLRRIAAGDCAVGSQAAPNGMGPAPAPLLHYGVGRAGVWASSCTDIRTAVPGADDWHVSAWAIGEGGRCRAGPHRGLR
jgi:hypothetical protein